MFPNLRGIGELVVLNLRGIGELMVLNLRGIGEFVLNQWNHPVILV